LSSYFADEWRKERPDAVYTYRDLAVEPIPHLTSAVRDYIMDPDGDHGVTAEERALVDAVATEVRNATTVLLAIPMYNYTIPSTLKAWIDYLVSPAVMVAVGAETGPLSGKPVVVITARGGSYAPGTPREGRDYQEPYLRAILDSIGLADDLKFVHAELTLAATVPAMEKLRPLGAKSLADAREALRKLAA
jgi:FMN-dependent NADH-azoreductase